MINDKAHEIIDELFQSLLPRHKLGWKHQRKVVISSDKWIDRAQLI